MLLKFLKSGIHEEPGSLSYLRRNETAVVLRGNPDFAQLVIDHSPPGLSQRFASCVINDLVHLDAEQCDVLLNEFEWMCLAGRPQSSMPWCALEHMDKGKKEIHAVIPLFDLLFRKWVHPYVDRIDRLAFSAWVEHFALRHNLDRPQEKLRTKPPFEHLRIREIDRKFLEKVWNFVHARVEVGAIKSREDLEYQLAAAGYQVRCSKHAGGQLQQPVILGPDGNSLRLTNSIYFRPVFGNPIANPLDRSNSNAVAVRLKELEEILRMRQNFRAFHLIGRLFGKAQQPEKKNRTAKKILSKLIDERLAKDRQVVDKFANFNCYRIFGGAYYSPTILPIMEREQKGKVICGSSLSGQSDKMVVPVVPQAGETRPSITNQAIDSLAAQAGSEAFSPQEPGETMATESMRTEATGALKSTTATENPERPIPPPEIEVPPL